MVRYDQVTQTQDQVGIERLLAAGFDLGDLPVEQLDAEHDVAEQLAGVGVAERRLVAQFVDLAEVVQNRPGDEQVGVDLVVLRRHARGQRGQLGLVLDQPAGVGVVQLDAGRGGLQFGDQFIILQNRQQQVAEVRVRECPHAVDQRFEVLAGRGRLLGQEVVGVELGRVRRLDVREDDLHLALVVLGLPADGDVRVRGQAVGLILADVPHQAADLPGPVAQLREQVQVAVAVAAQLLVGQQIDLVDGLVMSQIGHRLTARHRQTVTVRRRGAASEQ